MRTDIARGKSSTRLTRIRSCPDSTAASTANVAAVGSYGTPRVASITGRPAAAICAALGAERRRSRAGTLLGVKLPLRQSPNATAELSAPPRHVPQEPDPHHQGKEEDEPGGDKEREQAE